MQAPLYRRKGSNAMWAGVCFTFPYQLGWCQAASQASLPLLLQGRKMGRGSSSLHPKPRFL